MAHANDSLGPFRPPTDYAFEPELTTPPPRPIPPELRQGRHATKQRRVAWGFLTAAVVCGLASQLGIVRTWGLYLLPLQYLHVAALICVLVAVITFLVARYRRGPYVYVEEGIALIARVRALELRPTMIMNAQPAAYQFLAEIEYADPETGEVVLAEVLSNEFSAALKDRLTTSFHVGDYATAVYLPQDPERTLRLYGFLDLRPELGVVLREGATETGALTIALTVAAAFGIFGVLFWNLYALQRYGPVTWTWGLAIPFAIGAVMLGGGLLAWLAWQTVRIERQRAERNAEAAGGPIEPPAVAKPSWFGAQGLFLAIIMAAGALLLGGSTALCWALTANAWFDDSLPQFRPVRIEQFVETTHSLIIRDYTIEYRFVDDDAEKHTFLTTPEEIDQFGAPIGVAEVRAGRFGWPWVRSLVPLVKRE